MLNIERIEIEFNRSWQYSYNIDGHSGLEKSSPPDRSKKQKWEHGTNMFFFLILEVIGL